LVAAVTKIAVGGVYVSLTMAEKFALNLNAPQTALPHQQLSDREFDVFKRLVAGVSISEIANQLCVSSKTVSTYKTRVMEKLQISTEAALIRYAIKHRLFEDEPDL